jgi:hypothetical protein
MFGFFLFVGCVGKVIHSFGGLRFEGYTRIRIAKFRSQTR